MQRLQKWVEHTSCKVLFSVNFDKKVVTYLIFFVETFWFQKCNFWKKIPWAPSEVAEVKWGRMVKEPDLEAEKIQIIRKN